MHKLLLHVSINGHHRAVMMHHIPSSIMELKGISYIEWPGIHVDEGFHGNPSHVWHNPSPYISNLKVDTLLPIKCKLPTLYYSIIPEGGNKNDSAPV